MQLVSFPGEREGSNVWYCGDGYYYHEERTLQRGVRSFACRKQKCGGRARVYPGKALLYLTRSHSCPQDLLLQRVIAEKRRIRLICRSLPLFSIHLTVQHELSRLPLEVLTEVHPEALRRSIYDDRRAVYPPPPFSFEQMCGFLDEERYKGLVASCVGQHRTIFMGMVGPPGERCLVFAFLGVILKLRRDSVIFSDGTFRVAPKKTKCFQLLCVLTNVKDHVVPLAYALMQRNTEIAYIAVLSKLKDDGGLIAPHVVCDFELQMMNGWRHVFPECDLHGCLWHYCVCIYKRVCSLGLQHVAANDENVDKIVRCLAALPRAPAHDIDRAFGIIERFAEDQGVFDDGLRELFDYARLQWLQRVGAERLSVFGAYHVTNNTCEVHHKQINQFIPVPHPNTWDLLTVIRGRESHAMSLFARDASSLPLGRERREEVARCTARVRSAEEELLRTNDLLHFLSRTSFATENVRRRWLGPRRQPAAGELFVPRAVPPPPAPILLGANHGVAVPPPPLPLQEEHEEGDYIRPVPPPPLPVLQML